MTRRVPKFADFGLSVFAPHSHVSVAGFSDHQATISPEQIGDSHGVIVLTPRVTKDSLAGCDHLLAIARFGVGYDSVDVEACTQADVLAMITAGAVDRSVAEATISWMLALTHHLLAKDRLVRNGHWGDRTNFMGCELRDRTLGVIGLGGIGRSLVSLAQGFGMNQPIAFDPVVSTEAMSELGVRRVELDELLSSSDFVSIHCPLNQQTRGLIGAENSRDEARCLCAEYGARRNRRRRRSVPSVAGEPHRWGSLGLLRLGTVNRASSIRHTRQRHSGAAFDRLDE